MTVPYADLRKLSQSSPILELFTLSATNIGGGVYRFCNEAAADGSAHMLSGVPYYPMPVVMQGFGLNTTGAATRPTVSISNVSKELLGPVIALGDLVDARLTRVRMFAKHLDGGSSPDSTQIISRETFIVESKDLHTNRLITWSLSVPYDVPGTKLGRQVFRQPTHNSPGFPGIGRKIVVG